MSSDYLQNKPQRLNRFFSPRDSGNSSDTSLDSSSFPDRYTRLAEDLGGRLITGTHGAYCRLTETYPFGTRFGSVDLEKWPTAGVAHSVFSVEDTPVMSAVKNMVFLDTETTGLGGSGAVAFLIGCGGITANGFVVHQYLLPDYSDETAMLEDVMEHFADDRTVVSYNGATFDLPLLRDRLIVNRVARTVPHRAHLDLLHSARRLFRRRLGDCSLGNIERELFGLFREDDVPGYLVPSVYFDWLSSEDTEQLGGVLEHNRQDIVSLYLLMRLLHEVVDGKGESLSDVEDIHSLSRLFMRRRNHGAAASVGNRLPSGRGKMTPDILLFHSMALKRTRQWEEAVALWWQLADEGSREGYEANMELAKYHEHHTRDFSEALAAAYRARQTVPDNPRHREALRKRVKRLESRLAKLSE